MTGRETNLNISKPQIKQMFQELGTRNEIPEVVIQFFNIS